MSRSQDFFRGCLIGGAIGDALGWPVEFLQYDEIMSRFGTGGIQDLVLSSTGKAEITDDTQMTLFTAEGILRSETRGNEKSICNPSTVVFNAYQRWLLTQGYPKVEDCEYIYDGWLLNVKELHANRAPGNTCLSALFSRKQGSIKEPINNSKGCGGVMRVAPAGLFYSKDNVFLMAAEFAALTHGHPSGYLSAGALAHIIASIIDGKGIEDAVRDSLLVLGTYDYHEECTDSLKKALDLSNSDLSDIDSISRLGEGWIGEEALAISVYCALRHQHNFKNGLIAAVNHDGDSDSTGAITGNILGAFLGLSKILSDWVEKVELRDEIIKIADDLFLNFQDCPEWWKRYPGC